jgi:hypothetical protein
LKVGDLAYCLVEYSVSMLDYPTAEMMEYLMVARLVGAMAVMRVVKMVD